MTSYLRPIEERRLTGIAFMVIGYFCFTVIDTCAKWLTLSGGLPTGEVVFVRYAGQLLLVVAFFAPTRVCELVRTRRPWLEIIARPLPARLDRDATFSRSNSCR